MANGSPPRAARILIVDDSAVMRTLLRSVIQSDPRLEVAGVASDGASALRAIEALNPDLVLLDVEMPLMDGLTTLRQMRAKGRRIPVIMCSSLTQRGAKVTIEALAYGAADYVAKPSGQVSREAATQALAQDLIPKIIALTAAQVPAPMRTLFPLGSPKITPVAPNLLAPLQSHLPLPATPPGIVVMGISTGGPSALEAVLPTLPADFPLPILIVQHMPELFTQMLAERLDSRCPMRVVEAIHREPIRPGTIYIAKGNWHMEIVPSQAMPTLRLTQDPPENHCRPAVDVLFRSAVAAYGSRVLGIILTGMGYDGLLGCRLIREHKGTVLAQDEATSAVWGMPGAVAQAGLAHRILPLNEIASEILRLTGRGQREACALRESAV